MEQNKFYQIKNVTEHEYTLVGCDGSVIIRPIQDVDKSASVFTIQDAKDGDVLACNEEILLFKSYSVQGRISLYCWYNGQTNNFHSKEVDDTLLTARNKICPATKEQRSFLFQKMKEAGYEYDTEKKELKKIEQKPVKWSYNEDGQKQDVSIQINPSEYINDMGGNGCYLKNPEQDSTWSEEDEMIALSIEQVMNCASLLNIVPEKIDKIRTWLKSLKERVQSQPKQEWSKEDEKMFGYALDMVEWYSGKNEDKSRLVSDWLKSLRPQTTWKPSDEQMDALNYVVNLMASSERPTENDLYYNILKSLRQQLMKLKG